MPRDEDVLADLTHPLNNLPCRRRRHLLWSASPSCGSAETVAEPKNPVPFEPRRRRKILGLWPLALADYAAAAAAATTVGVFATRALLVPGSRPQERPVPNAVPESPPALSPLLAASQVRDEARGVRARRVE